MGVISRSSAAAEPELPSRWSLTWRALWAQRRVRAGAALLLALAAMAWIGPLISPWAAHEHDLDAFLAPPSPEHWWGTDNTGRDMFAATLQGLRVSLWVGLLAAVLATAMATAVGTLAGYVGGRTDRLLMWVTDLWLVLPAILVLAVVTPVVRGGGWPLFVAVLGALLWMMSARLLRGMTQALGRAEYVTAAGYLGVPPLRIVTRHILPNVAPLLIVDVTLNVSGAVVLESGLSFLGYGPEADGISLGTLLADGSRHVVTYPWTFLGCAGALVVLVLAVHLIGDGLRRAMASGGDG